MTSDEALKRKVLNKVTRRLIPLLLVLYIIAYLDRVNVGFAALQMNHDLGFSSTIYGFGSGVFFLGYFLFEIPSNLILERIGARVWIARISITWGVIAAGMMFVKSPFSFYLLRFFLGIAEAGFFPGIILYLTYWFPTIQRAKTIASFMTATAIAGVVGGPLSGLLLTLHGIAGLAGWQWLFLVEGLPAIVMGFVVLNYLCERPEQAEWLEVEERFWLQERLQLESEHKQRHNSYTLLQALVNPKVWLLSLIYFTLVIGIYGISFWLPQIIKGFSGLSDLWVGCLSVIPYLVGAIGMVFVGSHSDQTRERRAHVAIPAFIGAFGLVLSAYSHQPVTALASLSLAALGIWGALGPFWTLPTGFLSGTAAAGSLALINSVGNLGGFVAPYIIGLIKDATNSFTGGLLVMAAGLLVGGILTLVMHHDSFLEELDTIRS
ncbi:MAG: MFS transporter [Nostoc sp.]|uniref:MFS transporter n=1 Tax=Nostoc sp. TaxID=1180 RepID=UPI002FFA3FB0